MTENNGGYEGGYCVLCNNAGWIDKIKHKKSCLLHDPDVEAVEMTAILDPARVCVKGKDCVFVERTGADLDRERDIEIVPEHTGKCMNHWLGVVGGRDFTDYDLLEKVLDKMIPCFCFCGIVSGGARGADSMAALYADTRGLLKEVFAADWEKHGRVAGFLRNQKIVDKCKILIAFWDGKSHGTKDTIDKTIAAGKVVMIVPYRHVAGKQAQMKFTGI